MKQAFITLAFICIMLRGMSQNVGIDVANPIEKLHVDSVIKIGKNQLIGLATPGRKNLLKFGDSNFVSIGEELKDDRLAIRSGEVIFIKSPGSVGNGYIGIQTESPTANLDIDGSLRLRPAAGAGKVLTSDNSGNGTWQTPATTAPVGFRATLAGNRFVSTSETTLADYSEAFEDGGDNFEVSTGVFVVPTGGVYTFTVNVTWDVPAVNTQHTYITRIYRRRNNVNTLLLEQLSPTPYSSFLGRSFNGTTVGKFLQSDRVFVAVAVTSGTTTVIGGASPDRTSFSGVRLY